MDKLYLSKSRYCKAIQCKKILWMNEYKPEERVETARDSVLENGSKVGELARGIFGKYENVEYNKDLNVMINQTNNLLKNKPNIITEASFNYENNFCSVDILKNDTDGVEIYEVKSSTNVDEIYIEDASYQYFVLTSLGYNVKKISIVYLNNEYIRHGELELDKLFNIEDITETSKSKFENIKKEIASITNYMDKHSKTNEENKQIGIQCFKPYPCEYWEYCTKGLPENNIFKIRKMHLNKKLEYYSKRKSKFWRNAIRRYKSKIFRTNRLRNT